MWLLANGPVSFFEGVCAFLGNGPSLVWLGKSKPFVSSSFFPQFLCELPTQAPDHRTLFCLFGLGSRLPTQETMELPRLPTLGPRVGR